MSSKKIALAVMAAALLSTTALAQSSPPAGSAAPAVRADTAAVPATAQGKWRASKLIGLNVYNNNNEKIGDINELITDPSGKIDLVVIGVGGFLGIGEHNVGLPFSQVKFVNEPVRISSTATGTAPRTTGTGTATTTTTTNTMASGPRDYPDHAVVNMTKDQLKALPAFRYASDTSTTRTTDSPANRAPANSPANQAPAAPSAR